MPLRLPRLPRPRAGWPRRAARYADTAAVALVAAVAFLPARPLLTAADLATGAGDWHAHAFRIHDLGQHGLAAWTHDWAGGLPLWSAYQFVPHLVTWLAILITGASETRAMAVAQGLLLVWLPLSVFLVLRLSGISALAAALGALLAAALDGRRQPAANFSELWGLALVPLLLWAAWRTRGRRGGYATAVAVGAAVYVHPLAAVAGGIGMVAAVVGWEGTGGEKGGREGDGRDSSRPNVARGRGAIHRVRDVACVAIRALSGPRGRWVRRLGLRLLALALQLVLALGAAGFFVWPALASARPVYQHPYFASAGFERMLARLAVGSFVPGWPLWLGLAGTAALALALRGTERRRAGARFLLIAGALIATLSLASMLGWGPRLYRDLQLPRLLSVLPLLAAAAGALAVDEVVARMSRRAWPAAWGAALIGGAALALVGVAAVRDTGITVVSAGGGAFSAWLGSQPAPLPAGERVAAPPEVVAEASALAYGRAWYTSSYSGREWSILAGPLRMFMDGYGAAGTRAAYLTAMAVGLAVVPPGARPPLIDPRTGEPAAWQEVVRLDGADVLRPPWRAPYAFTVPRGGDAGLEVPDLPFTAVEDSYVRDELTRRWAALALGPSATAVRARARSGTMVDFALRAVPEGRVLLVSENWDTAWRAEAGDRRLPVRRAGPNLLAVDLDTAPVGAGGDVHVRLVHDLPRAWRLGGLVTLLTLPAALLLRRGPIAATAPLR